MAGDGDILCPPTQNFARIVPITTSTMSELTGFDHMAFMTNNS